MRLRQALVLLAILTVITESKARGFFRHPPPAPSKQYAAVTATPTPTAKPQTEYQPAPVMDVPTATAQACPVLSDAVMKIGGSLADHTFTGSAASLVSVSVAFEPATPNRANVVMPGMSAWAEGAVLDIAADSVLVNGDHIGILCAACQANAYTLRATFDGGCIVTARGVWRDAPTPTPVPAYP